MDLHTYVGSATTTVGFVVAESTLGWAYTNLGAPHCGKWTRLWVATDLPIYKSWFSVPRLFMEVNPLLCIVDLHHVIKHCTCAASALSEVGYTRKQMVVFRPHQCKASDAYIIWISTFKSEYDTYIYIKKHMHYITVCIYIYIIYIYIILYIII